MNTTTLIFAVLTAALAAVAIQAFRIGNEKRDVALLGAFSGLCGLATAVSAAL